MPQKSNPHGATEVLQDLSSGFERFAAWVASHAMLVGIAIGVVLAAGGTWEFRDRGPIGARPRPRTRWIGCRKTS